MYLHMLMMGRNQNIIFLVGMGSENIPHCSIHTVIRFCYLGIIPAVEHNCFFLMFFFQLYCDDFGSM